MLLLHHQQWEVHQLLVQWVALPQVLPVKARVAAALKVIHSARLLVRAVCLIPSAVRLLRLLATILVVLLLPVLVGLLLVLAGPWEVLLPLVLVEEKLYTNLSISCQNQQSFKFDRQILRHQVVRWEVRLELHRPRQERWLAVRELTALLLAVPVLTILKAAHLAVLPAGWVVLGHLLMVNQAVWPVRVSILPISMERTGL